MLAPDIDVPASDSGIGIHEIAYIFGLYKRLANEFTGLPTGNVRPCRGHESTQKRLDSV
jgi:glutamate dehydrogenase/leucine dehydrogenase